MEQVYVCQGVAEVRQRQEDGVFVLHSVEPFFKCPTPGCASTGVKIATIEAPVIDRSTVEREQPRLVYQYKGKCLDCGVSREGWYGAYMGDSTPARTPTVPHSAWLFHKV
jgi:hypothetical protein